MCACVRETERGREEADWDDELAKVRRARLEVRDRERGGWGGREREADWDDDRVKVS